MRANMPDISLLAQRSCRSEPLDHFAIVLREFDGGCDMSTMNNERMNNERNFLPHD